VDLFSFGFVLLILAAGGVIAYLADKLGKKIGKKKLSLRWGRFSLRPRHVAELGTVLMGIIVALLTILIVAAASTDARAWLREGRQLLRQRDELEKENGQLQDRNKTLQKDTERLSKTKGELEKKNVELARINQDQRKSLVSLQNQKLTLSHEVDRLTGSVASLQRVVARTEVSLRESRQLLAKERLALQVASAKLKSYQAKIVTTQKELAVANQNLVTAIKTGQDAFKKNLELYKENQQLSQKNAELEKESARVQAEIKDLNDEIADLKRRQTDAQRDLRTAQNQYTETQAQLVSATKDLLKVQDYLQLQQQFLSTNIRASRVEPITFKSREEVARFTIPGGSSTAIARFALSSLLRSARVEASNRGAKGHRSKNQIFEVADVFDRQDPTTGAAISADELKGAVISKAAGRVEDQVLVATSSYNAFAGEPVSLDITVMPNPVIYHQGEMLSEARIDGSLSEDRIFAQLSDFVRTRVRERAASDGMIPRAQTDAPFGEISTLDVLNVLRDVKKVGRAVRVQAFASEEIRAAEPLRLEFRLR